VYNFTTINIAAGSTLTLSGNLLGGPVFFLASGAVEIDGTIDISGQAGHTELPLTNISGRVPSAPGAGGYSGGVGGICPPSSTNCSITATNLPTAQPGNGPGGGAVAPPGFSTGGGPPFGIPGTFTGSQFLIPMIGGSGGGGHNLSDPNNVGAGGGAGGGALLIASSTSITVTGIITAAGGRGGDFQSGDAGGEGSGGAIRLMAPSITTNVGSAIDVRGGLNDGNLATSGRIRLEAFQQTLNGSLFGQLTQSTPFAILLPATPPSVIKVTSVAGIPINANPFSFPDASINSATSVPIVIQAQYIPPGTTPTLYIFSETGPDQAVPIPAL
jgi:hypothetical protein